MKDGPIRTAFGVYSDFANYAGGIYHHVTGGLEGGHAVTIDWMGRRRRQVLEDLEFLEPILGESGYFRIKRGTNECGIESQVTGSRTGSSWGPK